jgi:hypothetical protein
MHDCAGQGLDADHYVRRLEAELDKLGTFLSKGFEPKGRESAVDATIRIMSKLEKGFWSGPDELGKDLRQGKKE